MVAAPYTKLLTANIQVNLASGLILTSARAAEQAGVPRDRWIFIHAGAQAYERWHVAERHSALRRAGDPGAGRAALERAGVTIDEIAHLDVYSCFPSAVQVAARELGLAIDEPGRPLTVTGGLTFAGGPGNNYTSHAIATLVPRLRADPEAYGLATAVGWYLTKHALGIYSARPPREPFRTLDPGATPAGGPHRGRPTTRARPAIEAYTVQYDRDGRPRGGDRERHHGRGERALIRSTDPDADRAGRSPSPPRARRSSSPTEPPWHPGWELGGQ